MQLNQFLYPLRKWWWLLLAAGLVAAVTSYIVALYQPPIYRAHTTLIVGKSISDPNPNSTQLDVDRQLAQTYAELATQDVVYNATAKTLGLPKLPQYQVIQIQNSQLIDIGVVDNNPQRAVAVANELANQLIINSPAGPRPDVQARQNFINQQLAYFQKQIEDGQAQINQLQQQLGTMTSARQIQDTQTQIKAQQDKVTAFQETYATLLTSANSQASNIVTVLVPAQIPNEPVGPNVPMIAGLAGLSGIILAMAAAFAMETLSNTLRSPEEITQIIHAPVIGYIPEIHAKSKGMYSVEYPNSAYAESFRMLRTNLDFTWGEKSLKTILVGSAGVADGKSTVATNLALIMAQANKKVVLLGADLRQPILQELINVPNERGLSDVLLGYTGMEEIMRSFGDPPMVVIPSGEAPSNPAEILSSGKMNTILSYLKDHSDIVIIDSPPFFVSDATILASRVDGVLLVVRPDYTKKDALFAVKEQLDRIGIQILGVVVNAIRPGGDQYSNYYSRYGYSSDQENDGKSTGKDGREKTRAAEKNTPVIPNTGNHQNGEIQNT